MYKCDYLTYYLSSKHFIVDLLASLQQLFEADPIADGIFDLFDSVHVVWECFVFSDFVYFPVFVIHSLLYGFDRLQILLLFALFHQITSKFVSWLSSQLTHNNSLIVLSCLVAAFCNNNAVEFINGSVIGIKLFLFIKFIFFFLFLPQNAFKFRETSLIYHSKRIKEPDIAIQCSITVPYIQIQNFPSIFILKICIRHNNEVYSVELLRLPFNIAVIGGSNDILFLFMVEDYAIVVVLHHLDVFLEHELHYIEFTACQPKEVFELNAYFIERLSQHFVALNEPTHALQTLSKRHFANVATKMHQPIKHQIPKNLFFLNYLLNKLSVQNRYDVFSVTLLLLSAGNIHIQRYANVHYKTLQGAVTLSTYKVALRVIRLFKGRDPNEIGLQNFYYQQKIANPITFLADQVRRLIIAVQRVEDFSE